MWRESASTATVRARIGSPSSPLWIAVFATGQDLASDGSQPKPGVFYVFGNICAFWEADHSVLDKVEQLGLGNSKQSNSNDAMYRWSYNTMDDLVCEDDQIRISASQRGFKITKIDEYASVVRALNYLRKASLEQLQDSDDVHRAAILYPESTYRVKLAATRMEDEAEYVVQEIDGAIVTNLRIFYGTSVVKLSTVQMMRRGSEYLTATINKGLAVTMRCSPHRQGLVIRLWLARLPIKAYWDNSMDPSNISQLNDSEGAKLNDQPTGISDDDFERKRQIVILERLHKQFCAIDESGNGLIEEDELDDAMGPVFASDNFVKCFFRALDKDGNRVITFIEFASGMSDLLTSNVLGKIRFSFRMFDVDGDECITEEEMLNILKSLASTGDVAVGEDIMEEVCEGLFQLIDIDGSGVISADEYADALQSNPQVHELLRRIGLQAEKHSSNAHIADLAEDMICFGDPDWILCSSITQALLVSLNQVRSNCTNEHSDASTGTRVVKEPSTNEFLALQKCKCNVAPHLVELHGYYDDTREDAPPVAVGNGNGNSHPATEVVIYAPKVFDYLRSLFRISLQDYQASLGLKNIAANMLLGSVETLRQPKWDAQHKFSFISNDNRFLVHALSGNELSHLLTMLPQYAAYVKNNPNTLLPRVVGIHAIIHGKHVMPFIVLCNALRSEEKLWGTYYLQGIPERQFTQEDGRLAEKDLVAPIHLAPGWKSALEQQLSKDVSFLSASECVNYNLVAAVMRQPSLEKKAEKSAFIAKLEADEKKNQKRKKKGGGGGCCWSADTTKEEEPIQEDMDGIGTLDPQGARGNGGDNDGPKTLEDQTMFAQTSRQEGNLPPLSVFNEYFGGVKANNEDPIFFGLADVFHSYGDASTADQSTPTPDDFRERFVRYHKQWIIGEEEGADEDSREVREKEQKIPADMLQFALTRENGRKGAVGIDGAKKCIYIANHIGQIVSKVDLNSKELNSFVHPFLFSEKSKSELTIRAGYKLNGDGMPSFKASHRLRFRNYIDRTCFLSEVTKLQNAQSKKKTTGSLQTSTAKIFIGTWNVGDAPPADMKPWLNHIAGSDLVVLSMQECNYQVKGASPTKSCESDFFGLVTSHLSDYVAVVATSLWTIRMLVLVKKNQAHRVSDVRHGDEATGIGHVLGNKGGIAVGLRYDSSYLCFVGSHLAAHLEKVEARNSDFREIIEGVSPKLGVDGIDILGSYHHVFWCGDLNYRIDWKYSKVLDHCVKNDLQPLYQYDQLHSEMKKGSVFIGFSEPLPTFTPTYRFLRDTNASSPRLYDEWKHRVPSWCDRVLHKGLGNNIDTAKRVVYDAEHGVRSSDHSPVYAIFETQIRGEYLSVVDQLMPPAAKTPQPEPDIAAALSITNLRCESLLVADTFGLSDPWITFYCQLFSVPLKDAKTRTIWKTLNPEWTEAFELPFFPVELPHLFTEYVTFVVKDADYVGTSDPLGQAILPLDIFVARPFDPQEIELPIILHGQHHGTLSATVQLKRTTNATK